MEINHETYEKILKLLNQLADGNNWDTYMAAVQYTVEDYGADEQVVEWKGDAFICDIADDILYELGEH